MAGSRCPEGRTTRREPTEKGHTELKLFSVVVQRLEYSIFENMQAKLDCTCLPSFCIGVIARMEVLLASEWPSRSKSTKIFGLDPKVGPRIILKTSLQTTSRILYLNGSHCSQCPRFCSSNTRVFQKYVFRWRSPGSGSPEFCIVKHSGMRSFVCFLMHLEVAQNCRFSLWV